MARTIAELPKGKPDCRLHQSRCVGHGVSIAAGGSGAGSSEQGRRQRDLPGPLVVYFAIALASFTQVSNREVLRCLLACISHQLFATGLESVEEREPATTSKP